MANPTLQQYIEQQNNPWTKDNPTNSDYFQMITQQNMRDGMPQDVAEANAVQEMQGYMQEGINPMGPINGREAGYNESQGKRLQQEGAQEAAQAIADKQSQNNIMESFDQWLMQKGQAPVGLPANTSNRGWEGATDAMQNIRNLELPKFKR